VVNETTCNILLYCEFMKHHCDVVCHSTVLCVCVDCATCSVSRSVDRKRQAFSMASERSSLNTTCIFLWVCVKDIICASSVITQSLASHHEGLGSYPGIKN